MQPLDLRVLPTPSTPSNETNRPFMLLTLALGAEVAPNRQLNQLYLRFKADLVFSEGLLPFRGAVAQVDNVPKRRNDVGAEPFILVVQQMTSP